MVRNSMSVHPGTNSTGDYSGLHAIFYSARQANSKNWRLVRQFLERGARLHRTKNNAEDSTHLYDDCFKKIIMKIRLLVTEISTFANVLVFRRHLSDKHPTGSDDTTRH